MLFRSLFAGLRVADGAGRDVPARTPPTIQDLMRHTAGLSYGYHGNGPAHQAYVADGFLDEDLSNASFVDRLAALPLEHQPGTVWHYSHATDVLGRVLEVVSGHSLLQVLQETLFEPLGMLETNFQLPAAKRGRVAGPLPQPAGGRPQFFDPCLPRRAQRAGGGLVSTAHDYARFLRMLLGNGSLDGTRVLSPATVAYMTADHLGHSIRKGSYYPPGPGYGFGLGSAVRLVEGEVPRIAWRLFLERGRRNLFLGGPGAGPICSAHAAILVSGTAAPLSNALTQHGLCCRRLLIPTVTAETRFL